MRHKRINLYSVTIPFFETPEDYCETEHLLDQGFAGHTLRKYQGDNIPIHSIWMCRDGVSPSGFFDMIYIMRESEDILCIPAYRCIAWVVDESED